MPSRVTCAHESLVQIDWTLYFSKSQILCLHQKNATNIIMSTPKIALLEPCSFAEKETIAKILNDCDEVTNDCLVKHNALHLFGARLCRALHYREPVEEIFFVAHVLRRVLSCARSNTGDFTKCLGVEIVSELIQYLQTPLVVGHGECVQTKLQLLLFRLALFPWQHLPELYYGKLVTVLRETVRVPATPQICALCIYFLSEIAEKPMKKRFLAESPGLVEDVLDEVSSLSCLEQGLGQTITIFACQLLQRLAWGSTRSILAKKTKLNDVLFHLLSCDRIGTKAKIFEVIRQMSTDLEYRRSLTKHNNDALIRHLMFTLKKPSSRSIAINTLSRIIGKESAQRLASHKGCFDLLSLVARTERRPIATKAAHILKRLLAIFLSANMGTRNS